MLYSIDNVRTIRRLETARIGGDMAEDLTLFLNRSTRYCVRSWWRRKNLKRYNKDVYIQFSGSLEHDLLNFANYSRLLATMIKFDLLSESIIGLTKQSVQDKCLKIIRSVCQSHTANTKSGWTVTAIAATTSLAGWLVWDRLNAKDKLLLINMLEFEANRVLEQRIPYQRTTASATTVPCKARVCSEYLNVLNMAIAMMPKNANYAAWRAKHKNLQASAFAAPCDNLGGWNAENNGLIMDGAKLDERSMSGIVYNLDAIAIARLANEPTLPCLKNNAFRVYDAFNNVYISRANKEWAPIYKRNYDDEPQSALYLPALYRGYGARYANLYAMDVLAYCNDYADNAPRTWAMTRMKRMLIMQSQHSSGAMYATIFSKDRYKARESSAAKMASMAYLSLYLKTTNQF